MGYFELDLEEANGGEIHGAGEVWLSRDVVVGGVKVEGRHELFAVRFSVDFPPDFTDMTFKGELVGGAELRGDLLVLAGSHARAGESFEIVLRRQ